MSVLLTLPLERWSHAHAADTFTLSLSDSGSDWEEVSGDEAAEVLQKMEERRTKRQQQQQKAAEEEEEDDDAEARACPLLHLLSRSLLQSARRTI